MNKRIVTATAALAALLLGPAASAAPVEASAGYELASGGDAILDHDHGHGHDGHGQGADEAGEESHDHDGDGRPDHDPEDHEDEGGKEKPKDDN